MTPWNMWNCASSPCPTLSEYTVYTPPPLFLSVFFLPGANNPAWETSFNPKLEVICVSLKLHHLSSIQCLNSQRSKMVFKAPQVWQIFKFLESASHFNWRLLFFFSLLSFGLTQMALSTRNRFPVWTNWSNPRSLVLDGVPGPSNQGQTKSKGIHKDPWCP